MKTKAFDMWGNASNAWAAYSCHASTLKAKGKKRVEHVPQQQKLCVTGPLRRSICCPLVPDLSEGLNRGQRAARSSKRLGNVFLMGCKDKQITGWDVGLLLGWDCDLHLDYSPWLGLRSLCFTVILGCMGLFEPFDKNNGGTSRNKQV